ncbi:MAG TPA: RNA polymerase sigma factor FliA [Thiolapillus brandeum]|uniref:RNA polymerase sigma factor FliA n=1 Tax=Thiolapillus brandeum TaxID=1076588 RepID=A0A831WCJ2_9GAMM|nr:RNA polymerase sigma factor FliA [Thiolapillus brandeum]
MNMAAIYQETSEQLSYEEIVAKHMPLVKRVAYHLMARMPNSVQLDDLIQAGMIGLLEALQNYDASKGASFETYARIRIRGSMIDEVRRGDWTPRSVYHKARRLAEAMRTVENREQRAARDEEVAAELGLDLPSYYKILADTNGCHVLSYDDLSADGWVSDEDDEQDGPLPELQKDLFKEGLSTAISSLPEREQMVLSLYYDNEFNLREIGEVLGVSEARICQIHAQALTRLRSKMSDWVGDEDD